MAITQDDASAIQTLGSLDFAQIIGGPLVAAVNASAQSAQATAQYIMSFMGGTTVQNGTTMYQLDTVTFTYNSVVNTINQATSTSVFTPVSASLTVPLICLLPIPYLAIDDMTINFHAQIQSLASVTNTNIFGTTTTFDSGTGGFLSFFESAQMQVTVADQNVNTAVSQQSSTFSLDVSVHAGVAPIPAGMQQVLNIFNSTIVQQQYTAAS